LCISDFAGAEAKQQKSEDKQAKKRARAKIADEKWSVYKKERWKRPHPTEADVRRRERERESGKGQRQTDIEQERHKIELITRTGSYRY
jgi:hypothetical protein